MADPKTEQLVGEVRAWLENGSASPSLRGHLRALLHEIDRLTRERERMATAAQALLTALSRPLEPCGGCGDAAEVETDGELWCKSCLGSKPRWDRELPHVAALAALRAALGARHG